MKKLLSTALIILICTFAKTANAQVVQSTVIAPMIEAAQIKEVKNRGYKEVEAKVLNIPIDKLSLPEGTISVKLGTASSILNAREYKKIDIYVNSKYQRSIGVSVETKIYQNVLIAKDTIAKDSILTARNIETKRLNILSLQQLAINETELSREIIATKMYRPGDIIDKRFSKIKPDITRNAMVKVIFKTAEEMAITVDGTALIEGNIGNVITVQNKTYNKVYTGKVIAPNTVLVEI